MSSISFYMDREDTLAFLELFFVSYPSSVFIRSFGSSPDLPRYDSPDKVAAAVESDRHAWRFAILHPSWTISEPVPRKVVPVNGSPPYFSVNDAVDGPSFDFITSRLRVTDEGEPFRICGTFGDQASYQMGSTYIDRPLLMTLAAREVRKYILRNSRPTICREEGFRGAYACKNTIEEHTKGLWLRAGKFHYDPVPKAKRASRKSQP